MNYLWQETPPRPLRVIEEALEKALFQNAFLKRLITLFRRALGFYHQKGFTLLELAVMLGVTTMISFPLAAITYQFMISPRSTVARTAAVGDVRSTSAIFSNDIRYATSFQPGSESTYGSLDNLDMTRFPPRLNTVTYFYDEVKKAVVRRVTEQGQVIEEVIAIDAIPQATDVTIGVENVDIFSIDLNPDVLNPLEQKIWDVTGQAIPVAFIPPPSASLGGLALFANGSIKLSGSRHVVGGGIYANGSITISGSDNAASGGASAAQGITLSGSGNFVGSLQGKAPVEPLPLQLSLEQFYPYTFVFDGPADLNDAPEVWVDPDKKTTLKSGVYYSPKSLHISGSNIAGKVTLIAPVVHISGSHVRLDAFHRGVLAFAPTITGEGKSIVISGSNFVGSGALHATQGDITISGSRSYIEGILIAENIDISGSRGFTHLSGAVMRQIVGR